MRAWIRISFDELVVEKAPQGFDRYRRRKNKYSCLRFKVFI